MFKGTNLWSIWYRSEPFEIPYSTNKELVEHLDERYIFSLGPSRAFINKTKDALALPGKFSKILFFGTEKVYKSLDFYSQDNFSTHIMGNLGKINSWYVSRKVLYFVIPWFYKIMFKVFVLLYLHNLIQPERWNCLFWKTSQMFFVPL